MSAKPTTFAFQSSLASPTYRDHSAKGKAEHRSAQ